MKTLYAGPWIGEFGWEVMTWQCHLRALAPEYDKVVVCSQTGHRPLYEDFVDEFYEYDSSSVKANMWDNQPHVERSLRHFMEVANIPEDPDANGDKWLSPQDLWAPFVKLPKWDQLITVQPQKFISFGNADHGVADDQYDIVYHARQRDDWDSGFRNWAPQHCEEVMHALPGKTKIAAIGTVAHSAHVEGTDDLRGIPMDRLFNVLASAKILVGPISGPIHLGALCGTKHITWATKREHADRVMDRWNPLGTHLSAYCSNDNVWKQRLPWHPKAVDVVTDIKGALV